MDVRGYAICTIPRSGSNFLCQILAATGVMGRPLEWFNGPGRRALDHPDYPDEAELQLSAIRDLGATGNGVYGLKLFPEQFAAVEHLRWVERLPGLCFVHLRREDMLGSALSWARALQTGQYRSTAPRFAESVYDAALIARCLGDLARNEARWRLWFAQNGLRPLVLDYARVIADPLAAVQAVADLLGLDGPVTLGPDGVDLRIQADAETDIWRRRFIEERRTLDAITPTYSVIIDP